jgi:hypothetical protein
MPDNWTYVAAAYALAVVVFGGYWRWLARKEHDLRTLALSRIASRVDSTMRSRQPSETAPPRPQPSSRPPRQP